MVLVEADEQLAKQLANRVGGLENVRVLHAAVAAEPADRTYYRFNLPDVNSLRQPTGLRALYPGLRLVDEVSVTAQGIGLLLDSLDLDPDQANGLVIELAGEEAAVLEALDADDRLHQFREIDLVAGRDALYEGGSPAREMLDWLSERGFEIQDEDANTDSDRPRWRLRRDDRILEIRELRAQLAKLVTERDEAVAQSASKSQEAESLKVARAELEEKVRLLTEQLDQSRKDSEQREQMSLEATKRREGEFEAELANLQHHVDEMRSNDEQRTAEMAAMSQEAESLKVARAELEEKVRLLTEQLDQSREDSEQREQNLRNDAERQLAEKIAELEKTKSDLSVAIRLQALRDADIKELQSRYAKVSEVRDQQRELLVKLQQRLGHAAEYLNQLGAQPSDGQGQQIAGELIRALGGGEDAVADNETADSGHQ